MTIFDPASLRYNEKGLISAIAQDHATKDVLMLAWMNAASIRATLKTGRVTYWSRSRGELWCKGETSGNVQTLKAFRYDCDQDCLLVLVDQTGPACHTDRYSCFYNEVDAKTGQTRVIMDKMKPAR